MVQHKSFANGILVAVLLSGLSSAAYSLDETRLWLPKTYHKHYLILVKAAAAAEAIDRCDTVLEGTVDLSQSRAEHPIFRILCRQTNGLSYNEMVDGITFETLTTPAPVEVILSEAEKLALKLAEEARKAAILEQKKQHYWSQCDAAIRSQTKLMMELRWLTAIPPAPAELTEEGAHFVVDFDAKNMWGNDLQYQASCVAEATASVRVEVSKRQGK